MKMKVKTNMSRDLDLPIQVVPVAVGCVVSHGNANPRAG